MMLRFLRKFSARSSVLVPPTPAVRTIPNSRVARRPTRSSLPKEPESGGRNWTMSTPRMSCEMAETRASPARPAYRSGAWSGRRSMRSA
ncbi:hypothetical protein DSECCO2_310540 [anaerobic digester metagenome]